MDLAPDAGFLDLFQEVLPPLPLRLNTAQTTCFPGHSSLGQVFPSAAWMQQHYFTYCHGLHPAMVIRLNSVFPTPRLPDPDHCRLAVLNSLGSPAFRPVYEYIDQFIAGCSEPRLAFHTNLKEGMSKVEALRTAADGNQADISSSLLLGGIRSDGGSWGQRHLEFDGPVVEVGIPPVE